MNNWILAAIFGWLIFLTISIVLLSVMQHKQNEINEIFDEALDGLFSDCVRRMNDSNNSAAS